MKRAPMKRRQRATGPDSNTVGLVMSRSGGMCERCQTHPGEQIHHRTPRQSGGTRNPRINQCDNLVHLCSMCHMVVEMGRDQARRDGWLWPRPEFERGEARAVRVGSIIGRDTGRFVFLTVDGRYSDVEEEA